MRRAGVTQPLAREAVRTRATLFGAMLLRRGDVDAMICGTSGGFFEHLNYVRQVIGLRRGVRTLGTMNMLILGGRQLFICDTYVNPDPSPSSLAELTLLAAERCAVSADAERRPAFAFELWQRRHAIGTEDAQSSGADHAIGSGSGG